MEHTVVAIFDRRVTLEELPADRAAYTLARAWLHSHPDRLSNADVCRLPDSRLKLPPLPVRTAAQARAHQPLQSLPVPVGQEVYLRRENAAMPPAAQPDEPLDDDEGDEGEEGEGEASEAGEADAGSQADGASQAADGEEGQEAAALLAATEAGAETAGVAASGEAEPKPKASRSGKRHRPFGKKDR